jgi:peptide/nickel transport system permease protein
VAAVVCRFTRQSIVDVLTNDYIRTARAKGLSERAVIVGHALKPSMLPVVTIIGVQLGGLIGGSIVIEQVFTRPGMGRLLIGAVTSKDYPTIEAITLLLVATYLVFNLFTDVVYAWLDPRLRIGHGKA